MLKSDHSSRKGIQKFKLPCAYPTKEWLYIKSYLSDSQFNVLLGTIQHYKDAVIKFGSVNEMRSEYEFGHQASTHNVPNFIKYLCFFTCNDSVNEIKRRNFDVEHFICQSEGDHLGIIAMPYYPFGSIEDYKWTRANIDVLRNVLKQVVYAIVYAHDTFGFIHGDLHLGNVLVRHSKKKQNRYGDLTLPVKGIYPILMDFGKSKINHKDYTNVYTNIRRFLTLISDMKRSDIVIHCDTTSLFNLERDNEPTTKHTYAYLESLIDTIVVRYAKSELPKHIFP